MPEMGMWLQLKRYARFDAPPTTDRSYSWMYRSATTCWRTRCRRPIEGALDFPQAVSTAILVVGVTKRLLAWNFEPSNLYHKCLR
jgi:hypothetical protein